MGEMKVHLNLHLPGASPSLTPTWIVKLASLTLKIVKYPSLMQGLISSIFSRSPENNPTQVQVDHMILSE